MNNENPTWLSEENKFRIGIGLMCTLIVPAIAMFSNGMCAVLNDCDKVGVIPFPWYAIVYTTIVFPVSFLLIFTTSDKNERIKI